MLFLLQWILWGRLTFSPIPFSSFVMLTNRIASSPRVSPAPAMDPSISVMVLLHRQRLFPVSYCTVHANYSAVTALASIFLYLLSAPVQRCFLLMLQPILYLNSVCSIYFNRCIISLNIQRHMLQERRVFATPVMEPLVEVTFSPAYDSLAFVMLTASNSMITTGKSRYCYRIRRFLHGVTALAAIFDVCYCIVAPIFDLLLLHLQRFLLLLLHRR